MAFPGRNASVREAVGSPIKLTAQIGAKLAPIQFDYGTAASEILNNEEGR